jgi:YesN/AraC family two-component response regulator
MFSHEFDIITAITPSEALQIVHTTPDLVAIITDMKMPQMSGLQFIEKARLINDQIPYYILSGYDIDNKIQEALDQQIVKQYFYKPINRETVQNTLTNDCSLKIS